MGNIVTAVFAFFACFFFHFRENNDKVPKGAKMVPKKSQFSPKAPNFALVKHFRGRSQIPNPVLERLSFCKLFLSIEQKYGHYTCESSVLTQPWLDNSTTKYI